MARGRGCCEAGKERRNGERRARTVLAHVQLEGHGQPRRGHAGLGKQAGTLGAAAAARCTLQQRQHDIAQRPTRGRGHTGKPGADAGSGEMVAKRLQEIAAHSCEMSVGIGRRKMTSVWGGE